MTTSSRRVMTHWGCGFVCVYVSTICLLGNYFFITLKQLNTHKYTSIMLCVYIRSMRAHNRGAIFMSLASCREVEECTPRASVVREYGYLCSSFTEPNTNNFDIYSYPVHNSRAWSLL